MATCEEVTVSMSEVEMVKAEGEGDPDDPNKTQVILQLQPIATGYVPKATDRENVEIGCPITCGDCKALLLVKKFVCPGINVKCVKYEDQLISPKQFVHISGKATLKDWKRAIRMGGVMLRKMMDSGQLDFYQHSTLCTNTCRSTKFDLLINNTRFPPDGSGLTTPTSSQAQVVLGNGGTVSDDRAEVLRGKMDWISSSLEAAEKKESNEISDTLNFWKGIPDVGLLGEVVTNISAELVELLNGVQQRKETAALQDTEVAVLSNLAQVFGLLDSVKKTLESRREQTDPGQEQVLSTLANLEVQLEDQRKQQQVRALLSCPQPAKSKTPAKRPTKRPRLQRPASTATLLTSPIGQQASMQPQQFTVLSPISLSSVGQPFTMAGLPMLFTRYMLTGDGKGDTITLHPSSGLTLVGTANMQDSGQLGTVVSPLELLQLSQQAGGAEMVPLEGQAGHEHTVIEINPAPMEQAVGVMELQLTGGAGEDGAQSAMEVTMAAEGEETQCQMQEVQTGGVEGLQLDASGQLSSVQIVVIDENTQEENKVQ
uniref:Glucocorticoid modulatory element binding protein 1 n=1 Tax=Gasterosteus aculeatus aculeatus TaxID=481459 RepID=G3NYB1_GASAC